jgi:hypothetical protein
MNLLIDLSQLIILLPDFNNKRGNHGHNKKADRRGKPHTLGYFPFPHGTSLLINIITEYIFLDHEVRNFGDEYFSNAKRYDSF